MEFEAKFPADGFALGLGASDNANFQYCNGIAISNLNVFRTWKATSSTTNEGTQSSISAQHNTYYPFKFEYENGTLSIYANNTLVITYTGLGTLFNDINKTFSFQSWANGTVYIKNVKIKPL